MTLVSRWTYCLFAQDPAQPGQVWTLLVPFVVIGLLFYFIMIRPDRKKRDDVAKMQTNLKKNDKIVTIGGIVGVVVNAPQDGEEVTIRVDENSSARIRILRSAISRIVTEEDRKEGKNGK